MNEPLLRAFIEATRRDAFVRGQHDCATWALRALDAMHGTQLAAEFVGHYDTAEGARALLDARGWSTLADAAGELFGAPLLLPTLAQTGDLFYLPDGVEGICELRADATKSGSLLIVLDDKLVGPAATRLAFLPLMPVIRRSSTPPLAWRAFPGKR